MRDTGRKVSRSSGFITLAVLNLERPSFARLHQRFSFPKRADTVPEIFRRAIWSFRRDQKLKEIVFADVFFCFSLGIPTFNLFERSRI